ncbi:N-6 DNA methylase [Paraburkholderia sp. BCC1886]|uniref:N-6 DNA methylase n=1 Tax=Paraburkholderia sp. BCC1886 TaxID=2562670 RepID=UPI00118392FD|nr:N-6 DNA methylase [Paraburkholderia sp. BCC1886]
MSKRAKQKLSASRNWVEPHRGELIKAMREFSLRHSLFNVFSDFIEISAIALSNKFHLSEFDRREKRYFEIIGKYTKEELNRLAKMFAHLQQLYQDRIEQNGQPGMAKYRMQGLGDVLGEIYMELELGSDRAGQFFTPYTVSFMMAQMTIGDGKSIREQGFIELHEPACGSAGMVVATADAMHQVGLNYPQHMHAVCIDIDPRCVHMAYVQLSLLGVAATIVHGNALTLEQWDTWYTPPFFIAGWPKKLQQRRMEKTFRQLLDGIGSFKEKDPAPTPARSTMQEAA